MPSQATASSSSSSYSSSTPSVPACLRAGRPPLFLSRPYTAPHTSSDRTDGPRTAREPTRRTPFAERVMSPQDVARSLARRPHGHKKALSISCSELPSSSSSFNFAASSSANGSRRPPRPLPLPPGPASATSPYTPYASPNSPIRPLPRTPGSAVTLPPTPAFAFPPSPAFSLSLPDSIPTTPELVLSPAPAPPRIETTSPPPTQTVPPSRPHLTVPSIAIAISTATLLLPPSTDSPKSPASVCTVESMLPIPPSPATRRRRNLAKLHRHLGPGLPPHIVSAQVCEPAHEALEEEEDEIESDLDDSSAEDEAKARPTQLAYMRLEGVRAPAHAVPPKGMLRKRGQLSISAVIKPRPTIAKAHTASPTTRRRLGESRHWYREKGGKRLEKDYDDVIAQLRRL